MGDDYMRMARVDTQLIVRGFAYAPLDLFSVVSGDPSDDSLHMRQRTPTGATGAVSSSRRLPPG